MKKLFAVLGILLLAVVYWRSTSSRHETGSSTISSWNPRPAQPAIERKTSSVTTPPMRAVAGNARADAIAAFERKRRAAGNENAPPLPPPMDAFKNLKMSEAHTINDRPFQVLGASAVPADRFTGGNVIMEANGYKIVERADGDFAKAIYRADARPVLVSPNGRVAVLTGTLVVKLRDMSTLPAVAASEGLQVLAKDEEPLMRTAYLRPPEGYALLEGQKRLQADPRVERVELELDQSRKEQK